MFPPPKQSDRTRGRLEPQPKVCNGAYTVRIVFKKPYLHYSPSEAFIIIGEGKHKTDPSQVSICIGSMSEYYQQISESTSLCTLQHKNKHNVRPNRNHPHSHSMPSLELPYSAVAGQHDLIAKAIPPSLSPLHSMSLKSLRLPPLSQSPMDLRANTPPLPGHCPRSASAQ